MLHFVIRSFTRCSRNTSAITIRVPYTTSSSSSVAIAGSIFTTRDRDATISYLTRVWGLSPELATSAAKRVTLENTETADSVYKLLKSHGFDKADVAKLISKQPGYVAANAETDLLRPKMEYLMSLGISVRDLPLILCSNKGILPCRMEKMVLMFDFFKQFLKSDEDLVRVIRNSGRVLIGGSKYKMNRNIFPNLQTLQAHGVPYNVIMRLMAWNAQGLCVRIHLFGEAVKRVEELGFDPGKVSYMHALNSFGLLSKDNWQKKGELFASFGWSEQEFISAYKKQPLLMFCSDKKIGEVMEFLVKKLGFAPCETAMYPHLLLLSLKERMVPRCSVLQLLISNGKLKKKTTSIVSALKISRQTFCEKYVTAFEKDVPDVVKAYRGELEFNGFTDDE